jgi:hypothetical protein
VNDGRWGEVKAILAEVLETSAAERPAILDRLCGNQRELRQAVESMLEGEARAAAANLSVEFILILLIQTRRRAPRGQPAF